MKFKEIHLRGVRVRYRQYRYILFILSGIVLVILTLQMKEFFYLNTIHVIPPDDCEVTFDKISCHIGNTSGLQTGSNVNKTMKEVGHIAFLKVHKAASTTVMNILMRFGYRRNLSFVLPKSSPNIISQKESISENSIYPSLNKEKFDILCHHVIFSKKTFEKYLHKDAFYVTILRDPFDQFVSSFYYYRRKWAMPYLMNITLNNPMSELLRNPHLYEPNSVSDSFTNNRMSFDLGFPPSLLSDPTQEMITTFISYIQSSFQFVMIQEYFDESIVLLKHYLNWTIKDILYVKQNIMRHYVPDHDIQPEDRLLHRHRAKVDYALYDHFLFRFWNKVRQRGPDFHREVAYFRRLRGSVQTFCRFASRKGTGSVFSIHGNEWHDSFNVTKDDCTFIKMNENQFTVVLKETQYPFLKPTLSNLMIRSGRRKSAKRMQFGN